MWGIVLSLFATTSNFGGAVTIRLFLGIFEAAVTPGFALFTSQVCSIKTHAEDD
jgi:MFS transporter, ACS family, allantoate permease